MKLNLLNLISVFIIDLSSDKNISVQLVNALYSTNSTWLLLGKLLLLTHHFGYELGAQ